MSVKVKITGLILGTTIIAFSACTSKKEQNGNAANGLAIAVTVATPSVSGENSIDASGQVESSQTANISTRVMGYITKLNVNIGDRVHKGQVLGTISNDDILAKRAQADAAIMQAETAVKNAQKDYDRFQILYKQQSASAKEVENVTMQYTSAKSALETAHQMRNEANAMLSYTTLSAPFDGVVTQRNADAGNMANPGMPILTIEGSGDFQVVASIPENAISQIKQGAKAIVTIKAANKTISGNIAEVSASSQATGGQYLVKINIPANEKAGLYGGMYANVSIPVKPAANVQDGSNSILVPVSSIEQKDELTGLYTVSANNTAMLRWVRLGKTYGDKIEVLSGLGRDERFILNADGKLYNGEPVTIK
ncbi:MAG: efflux RND transporter periplasmic adaptor subunit [Bacteroidetes bacterium]|nr:efflux RND transporter periplasmic adaptor subunit [Bacteroidota bacterium]